MFVKWSCGCRGIQIGDQSWVIENCDKDWSDPVGPNSFFLRDMAGKSSKPLDESEVNEFTVAIRSVMHDGHLYREIKSLLGIKS